MTEVTSAQTLILPSLSVSEAYDSNVFNTPKSQLSPGQKPEDYITFITPQINVAHGDQFIKGSLTAGAVFGKYVNNPELGYTGYNTAGQLNLTGWANSKVSRRITTLSLVGTFQYSPTRSGFGTVPNGSGVGTTFGSTQIGPLNSGFTTTRVRSHVYSLGVIEGYQLTPATTLTGMFNYVRLSFSSQSTGQNEALFDTTGYSGSAALNTQLTPRDQVGPTATVSSFSQNQSTVGGTSSFTTVMGTAYWTRTWTQEWTSTLRGGAYVIPGSSTPGQSATWIAPTGTVLINYRSFSEALRAAGATLGPFDESPLLPVPFANLPTLVGALTPGGVMSPGQYNASLAYTFSVYPSYGGGAGAIRAHVVGINATGGITAKLTGQVGVNYSQSSGTDSSGSYTTYGLTAGLRYLIGPVLAQLTANYLNFQNSIPTSVSSKEVSSVTALSKEMVMLTLSTAFNSQSFFRMDGFGMWGTPSSGEGTPAPSGGEPGSGSSGAGPGSGSSGAEPRK